MATSSTVARPFNALSGAEIKQILIREFSAQLDGDYRFKNHLTYPMVSWRWELAMKMYPSEQPDVHIVIDKTLKSPGFPGPFEGLVPVELKLSNERVVAAPAAGETADSARRSVGLEVPAPRVVRGPDNTKQIVDAPALPIEGQNEPAKAAEVTESSVARSVNRARESKTIPAAPARSVAVRTRANPHGVEVAPAAGSPPDEGRMQEIADRENAKPAEEPEP